MNERTREKKRERKDKDSERAQKESLVSPLIDFGSRVDCGKENQHCHLVVMTETCRNKDITPFEHRVY